MLSNEDYSATNAKQPTSSELLNSITNESDTRKKRAEALGRILNTQEKQIISLRFGIPNGNEMTLEQVGKLLGITRERVRQIQNKALGKLRGHPSLKFLEDFLE
jgi:RNA polymerase primary sigma factor